MENIIFVNGLKRLKGLAGSGENFCYLLLDSAQELTVFLKNHTRFCPVGHERLSRALNDDFQKKYIEFIARLNNANKSFLWWALNLTGKSPFSTRLCERLFNFCLIIKTYYESSDTLIVICDDLVLSRQVKAWGKKKKIKVFCMIRDKLSFTKIAKGIIPVSIIYAFCRTLLYKFHSWRYCRFKISRDYEYTVLKTILSKQSFNKEGIFFDTYFGRLIDYLDKENVPHIFLTTVFPPYTANLNKAIYRNGRGDIVPIEKYLSIGGATKCFAQALLKYFLPFRLKDNADFEGFDVEYLVKETIRQDCTSTRFFTNFLMYCCTASLAQNVKIKKVFYPFENRSWEKMLILALRKYSPSSVITGYQHSFITPKHTEMYLGKEEDVPLPDRIITNGKITRDILERACNFSPAMLRVGCALRQKDAPPLVRKNRTTTGFPNILVIMSVSVEYYMKVIAFLNKVFFDGMLYNIALRPHPEIPHGDKLQKAATFKFQISDKESLDDALNWADIVVYHSSAAAIRAVSFGIPVIYLKMDDFLDPDPLFDFNRLKWTVTEPQELIGSIERISAMSESEFKSMQDEAVEYGKRYFYPAADNNLKEFLHYADK